MTNLFGALDITEISEVPEDGTHYFVLKKARTHHSKNGNDWAVFEFYLHDDDSAYNGHKVEKWFRIYPNMTGEELNSLDGEEKKYFIKNLNQYKAFLRQLNVPENEMGTVDFTELTGLKGDGYGYSRDKRDGSGKEWVLWSFKPE